MEIAILVVLVIIGGIGIVLQISNSLLLIKTFEFLKNIQENANIDEEKKSQAKGLVDVVTEQAGYPLRLR
jgi:hypothetical protein